MLAALLIAFFLGGSGASGATLTQDILKDFGHRSEAAIADPIRAEAVATEVKALRGELKRFDKVFAKSGKSLRKLYKDHDADSASMRSQLDSLDAEWEAAQSRALDHRFNIRANMTRDEWQTVFAGQ